MMKSPTARLLILRRNHLIDPPHTNRAVVNAADQPPPIQRKQNGAQVIANAADECNFLVRHGVPDANAASLAPFGDCKQLPIGGERKAVNGTRSPAIKNDCLFIERHIPKSYSRVETASSEDR